MKVMTVLGTRPEIIRLSRVIALLDELCDHTLVHTGQNFAASLSDVFFAELGVRAPDLHLGVVEPTFGASVGRIFACAEQTLSDVRPDRLLVLGDTNSALTAFIAKRMQIPVFHMEAGNRCFDERVPEEVNRRVIDHVSDVHMPYTERSRANLLREGIAPHAVFVTGNPIGEVMAQHAGAVDASDVLARLGLDGQRYFLVTMHRQENVDVDERLRALVTSFERLAQAHGLPVICSIHPRTRHHLDRHAITPSSALVRFLEPFGFADFVALERDARVVLTDSGTVQEECCILGVPAVTIRDVTERPETIECGSNVLSGVQPEDVMRCVDMMAGRRGGWTPPQEYLRTGVAETATKIVLGVSPRA